MNKVEVLMAKPRPKQQLDVKVSEDGHDFEFGFEELSAIDEIDAGDLAREVGDQYRDGISIAGKIVEPTPRTWILMCRLHLMQRKDCRLYSPEEFLHIFVKFPAVADAVYGANLQLASRTEPGKAKAPTSGKSRSKRASAGASTQPSRSA